MLRAVTARPTRSAPSALGVLEIDLHARGVVEGGDLGAGAYEGAQAHASEAKPPGERGADDVVLERALVGPHARVRGLHFGAKLVDAGLGHVARLQELVGALVEPPGEFVLGPHLVDLGGEPTGIELDQHGALRDRLPLGERDRLDDALDRGRDDHRFVGTGGADRADGAHHFAGLGRRHLDRYFAGRGRARRAGAIALGIAPQGAAVLPRAGTAGCERGNDNEL